MSKESKEIGRVSVNSDPDNPRSIDEYFNDDGSVTLDDWQQKKNEATIPYDEIDGDIIFSSATKKGLTTSLCKMLSVVKVKLINDAYENNGYNSMGEMLSDCFCNDKKVDLSYHFRCDVRIIQFITEVVEEKLNDKKYLRKFIKENF